MALILGIESSCDETAAAVVQDGYLVRSNVIASQHDLHRRYGGVVPEIASRAHLERLTPTINEALQASNITFDDIDAVAVGNRPGLIGSLLVGASAAKTIAWSLDKPLIGIDHIHAHLYAARLVKAGEQTAVDHPIRYPALGLVVSGGHTSLYELSSATQVKLIGRTIDDAVGEAYDKAAVILHAGYPGGPAVDKLAQRGDASQHQLPRSLLGSQSLDFSFSGLKTSLLYAVRGKPVSGRGNTAQFEHSGGDLSDQQRADFAASFQLAAVETLITKLERAIDQLTSQGNAPRSVIIGGGVSANSLLRRRVVEMGVAKRLEVRIPPMAYCLDNAAMIAGLAHEAYQHNQFDDLTLSVTATTSTR